MDVQEHLLSAVGKEAPACFVDVGLTVVSTLLGVLLSNVVLANHNLGCRIRGGLRLNCNEGPLANMHMKTAFEGGLVLCWP